MATQTLTYPTDVELKEVEQNMLPQLVEDDPIFDIFPMVESNRNRLRWVQKDNFTGMQQVRGLNGSPASVKMVGYNEYDFAPGVYGEFIQLDEAEITERRLAASYDEPVSLDDLVGEAQMFLLQRRIDRIRYIIWTLLTTGTFAIAAANGLVIHKDIFPLLTQTAAVPWATLATATPTADIRTAQQKSVGQSVDFGAGAEMWMNQVTANNLLANANPNDFFGKRINGGSTINTLQEINAINTANNLPNIVVYDRAINMPNGTASGTPVKLIPNGVVVLIGKRSNGAAIGEYRLTRNFVNPRLEPGAYTRVVDTREMEVPGKIMVHDGHNGGPIIQFPGAVVVLTVA